MSYITDRQTDCRQWCFSFFEFLTYKFFNQSSIVWGRIGSHFTLWWFSVRLKTYDFECETMEMDVVMDMEDRKWMTMSFSVVGLVESSLSWAIHLVDWLDCGGCSFSFMSLSLSLMHSFFLSSPRSYLRTFLLCLCFSLFVSLPMYPLRLQWYVHTHTHTRARVKYSNP